MIFNLNKLPKLPKINNEIAFLFLLMFVTILSTTFYNNKKNTINENYKNTLKNIYFQKTIAHILNNLSPKYKNINHKISEGETFDKVLNKYSIPSNEIIKIKKKISKNHNLKAIILSYVSLEIYLKSINPSKLYNYIWFDV